MFRNYKNYTVYFRKDGRYSTCVTDHGHATYIYGKTKKEVEQKLEVLIDQLNVAELLKCELSNPTKYITLKNWAYLCLDTYCVANIQGNTYMSYERMIRLHFGELGDMPIGRITSMMIQSHITNRSLLKDENGMSENSLRQLRDFLHMVFNFAVQNNLILHNPTIGVRIPKTGVHENRALTPDEVTLLVNTVRNSDRLIMFSIILSLFTGLRKGESLA